MVVHWASDAREMNRIVLDILRGHGGRTLIKSKSMLSEECGLAPFLAGQGIDAVESDLGERIMQLMHRPPSHIVLPAIHVRREEVGETLRTGTRHGAGRQRSHLPDARGAQNICAASSSRPTSP